MFSLEGKLALVTGSSRGLGYSMAKGLADAGAAVILNGRNEARLADARGSLENGSRALHTSAFDTTDSAAVTLKRYGSYLEHLEDAMAMNTRVVALVAALFLVAAAAAAQETDLDLREANVTAVNYEPLSGSGYRFSVTLIHDDAGEAGYANWWQVETTDGRLLGRRELLHAHGTREFTRSETIEIPSGTTRVVVRGHDQTHGYGGQVMIVDIETGRTETVRQGPEPRSFADR